MSLRRLKREQYAVGEAERGPLTVTVGIYFEVPAVEDVEELTHTAQTFAQVGLNLNGGNHLGVVEYVQRRMDDGFTGRPFYVETREEGRGVQVYQPYGMPQDAP